ncbi:MAG: hypothetical protein JRJ58_07605, partial [Deltaproteobacteria bacterium]|nr:hypothetical protein [Deltaproteobacteria bacterium]
AHSCHQIFGALGITLEGPAFHLSRRILQLAALAPGAKAAAEALYSGIQKSGALDEVVHDERGNP